MDQEHQITLLLPRVWLSPVKYTALDVSTNTPPMCPDTHYSYSAQKTARTQLLYSAGCVWYCAVTVMHR